MLIKANNLQKKLLNQYLKKKEKLLDFRFVIAFFFRFFSLITLKFVESLKFLFFF